MKPKHTPSLSRVFETVVLPISIEYWETLALQTAYTRHLFNQSLCDQSCTNVSRNKKKAGDPRSTESLKIHTTYSLKVLTLVGLMSLKCWRPRITVYTHFLFNQCLCDNSCANVTRITRYRRNIC